MGLDGGAPMTELYMDQSILSWAVEKLPGHSWVSMDPASNMRSVAASQPRFLCSQLLCIRHLKSTLVPFSTVTFETR